MFKDLVVSNGVPSADVDRASLCIYLENFPVQSDSFGASHLAFGYFVFAEDGSLISYQLDSTHFGL